ncbi:dynein heavy chain 6, axonemal-like [Pollicipes pollicipes]|uniref:dynein heavy chain 6, axonemal-like n=1 Tax=Pollicipes pollicipes TaxID=41117 RepID=UPI0018859823|nr:dynein heavy chain 6, axonemal-like [Pollicipes pollicipes]
MVQIVLEAVCILLGAKTDWSTAKQILSDSNFLKRLMEYDKENIPETVLKKIKKYVDDPKFVPEVVEKVSKACKSMCLWVRAIDLFARVFKEVEPKRQRLQGAEEELASVMATLKEKQDRLAAVEAQIGELQSLYDHSVAEKQSLEDKIAVTSARLARASKLTSALGDEGERWAVNVETLDGELGTVVGNMFIGAASVSYLGAFTSQFRDELLQHWIEMCQLLAVPIGSNFSLQAVLADPYQIRQWNACGLPRDDVSTLNAILSCRSRRWPLMIDPQDQANQWIRRMEAMDGLKVAKMSDGQLLRVLETCIRLGLPMLIEAVGETLEAALEPVLLRQTYLSGGRLLIKLGDSEVDYEKSFRMYMTTKLGNPHYLPEVCIKVTLVNFTVTQSGLEDQLLGDVVRLEEPKIEETRNKLIVQINADKAQLRSIEDKILYMLFTSEGNILDNEQLIVTLNESKITSRDISIRLTEAESTEVKISAAREKYRPVALRGSIVYFVIAQLADVDAMYQYSLKYFNQIFNSHIESTRKNPDLEEHLANLIENTTTAAYTDVARGLFEKDKLIFSFVLCIDIMRQRGSVTDAQWNFLLRGAPHLVEGLGEQPSPVKWYSDGDWKGILSLELAFPDQFTHFAKALTGGQIAVVIGNETITVNPEAAAGSSHWDARLTSMEKLLAVRMARQEQLALAVTEFVRQNLGSVFIERPAIDLPTLYPNIDRYTPLIFVLSQGTDPMGEFMGFTRDREMEDRVAAISLGQGQGPVAEKAISDAIRTGDWVFLQNCHLSASWMPCLEAIIKDLPESTTPVHESFRLFLSSMPAKAFPVEILQNSVKVTNEPPRGLRNSLRQAFAAITPEFFDDNVLEISWRRMVFGLCFFHAVIQERKKYGPLGWNIGYEFTTNDRDFALDNLRLFCKDGVIPWEALQYITGEITYGGRVTDNWDQRCLTTILTDFFSPAAMDPDHKYSPSGIYYAPSEGGHQEYKQYVDNLPVSDSPEIFGMHVNADVVSKVQETYRLLTTILSMQPWLATSGGGEGSGDQFVYDLAETMEGRIPVKIDMEVAHKKLFELDDRGRMNSLTTVLVQEVDRYNRLLRVIHSTLADLKRAIRGLVVMSEELDRVYRAFVNNQVPAFWGKVGYLSVKSLGSWVTDLIMRVDAFADWSRYGPPPSFWFSGFFFPQGFLTGILQNFARKHSLPIDQLRFQYEVQKVWRDQADIMKWRQEMSSRDSAAAKDDPEPGPFHRPTSGKTFISWVDDELSVPEEGLLIHGLFIDAGRWDMDNMTLTDPLLGELKATLPVLHVLPAFEHVPNPTDYSCPTYRTPVRAGVLSTTGHSTNFVVDIQLPCDQPEEHWITQGTALLTLLQD